MANGSGKGRKALAAISVILIVLSILAVAVACNFDKIFVPKEPDVPVTVEPEKEEEPPENTEELEPVEPEPTPEPEPEPAPEPEKEEKPEEKPKEDEPKEEEPDWEVVIVDGSNSSGRPSRPSAPAKPAVSYGSFKLCNWNALDTDLEGEAQNMGRVIPKEGENFTKGDSVKLYAWTDEQRKNMAVSGITATFDGSTWNSAVPIDWNGLLPYYFTGIYAANGTVESLTADSYKIEDGDVMVANRADPLREGSALNLNFEHLMAKLTVNLNFRNQWGETPEVESVMFEGYTEATVNYLEKTVTATKKGNISLVKLGTAAVYFDLSYSAVVIPSSDTQSIRVRIDNKDYIYNCPDYIPFESGKAVTINLNVGKDEITLANVYISDWQSQGDAVNGTADREPDYSTLPEAVTAKQNEGISRAEDKEQFNNGTEIKVFGWIGDKTVIPLNPQIDSVNTLETENGINRWKAAPQMLWQSQTAAHYFVSVYPSRNVSNFAEDGYSLAEGDLLVAVSDSKGIVANNRGVDLTFEHLMSKIKVNLSFTGTEKEVKGVYAETYTAAKINYLMQTAAATGEKSLVKLTKNADGTYETIAIPNTDTIRIYIYLEDGSVYKYSHPTYIPLERGEFATLNITVDNFNITEDEIKVAGSIKDWAEGKTITGYTTNRVSEPSQPGGAVNPNDNPTQAVRIPIKEKTDFENLDAVRLFVWTGNDVTDGTNHIYNGRLTAEYDGAFWTVEDISAEKQLYWKDEATEHNFLAVYPKTYPEGSAVGGENSVSFTGTYSQTNGLTAEELLIATANVMPQAGAVNLEFEHVMAKLLVNIKTEGVFESDVTVDKVKIYANDSGTVDYLTKTLSAGEYVENSGTATLPDGGSLSLTKTVELTPTEEAVAGYRSYSDLMIPQTGVRKIEITLSNGAVYIYEAKADIPLAAGKITTVNITVSTLEINFKTAGTLATTEQNDAYTLLDEACLKDGTLIVKGNLNADDLKVIGSWAIARAADDGQNDLVTLDLSGASIAENKIPGDFMYKYGVGAATALKKVILPATITEIDISAFNSCTALEEINLENVTVIGMYAFHNCTNLKSVDLSKAVTLKENAFKYSGIEGDLILPAATYIGSCAFEETKITKADFPEVTVIQDYSLSNCTELKVVKLPKATTLGANLFNNSTKLEHISITSEHFVRVDVDQIGYNLFTGIPYSARQNITLHLSHAYEGKIDSDRWIPKKADGTSAVVIEIEADDRAQDYIDVYRFKDITYSVNGYTG